MTVEGFIILHRKLLGSDIASKGADLLGLFILLLLRAAWKPMHYRGHRLERGQCAFTLSELAQESKLTERQIRIRLKALSDMGTILTDQRANRFHLVTLTNWALYQDKGMREGRPKGRQRADRGQTAPENARDASQLYPPNKATIPFLSEKGEAPRMGAPLSDLLGEYRKRFKDAHGTEPAKAGMGALGKAARQWTGEGFTLPEILRGVGAFFEEAGRRDHDPLHFLKFFRNGYSGKIVAERTRAEEANASHLARDLATVQEARERWEGSLEWRNGAPAVYLKNYLGRLWTPAPYPAKLGAALCDLAGLLGVEAPC